MIVRHDDIRERVFDLYRKGGLPRGSSTGWASLDELYTVSPGQWTCVTGTPNSGKSEFVDAMLVNLAKREPWKFYIYSPENWPLELHHAKILEKYTGKPFTPGPTERMDEDELDSAEEWMRHKFYFCKPDRPDILSILDGAEHITSMAGSTWKTGVVIDPWNQLEHHKPQGQTMTEYVSETLSYVIDRVRSYNIHLWLIAHPAKMRKDRDGKYPVPTPHDIADSAHFWNKSDNCITVWRDQVEGSEEVDIHVQKVRFKNIGRIGLRTLIYNRVTGQYRDKPGEPQLRSLSDYRKQSA